MAVAFVRSHGNSFIKVNGGTVYLTTSLVPAGSLLVMAMVHDNTATANSPTASIISKGAGETNSWVLLGRATYPNAGTAGAFASGELWVIKTTVDWASGTSLSCQYTPTNTMKAQNLLEFSGAEATVRGTVGTAYSTTTTAANASTSSSTAVIGDLALGLLFGSNVAAAQAGSTHALGGTWSTPIGVGSTGGNVATNNFGVAQYKTMNAAAFASMVNSAAMTAGNGSICAILQPALVTQQATASLVATSTLEAAGFQQTQATAALVATSTLTATATRTAAGVTSYRVLDEFTPPDNNFTDTAPITVSMEFYVDADGCTATKAYFDRSTAFASDTWTMKLWQVDSPTTGTVLATKALTYDAATPAGWVAVTFDSPVPLTANQRYRVSGTPASENYAATGGWWTGTGPGAAGIDDGPLHAPPSGTPGQGQFVYSTNGFTVESFNGGNYWVDIEVSAPGAGGPVTQQATAALVATSTLTATAVRQPQAAASLTATSTLTTTAVRVPQATAALVATSTLTTTGVRVPQAAVSLIATSTLAATSVVTRFAAAALTAASTFGAAGVREPQAAVPLVATSTLTVSALRTVPASAALTATSTLTSEAVGVGVVSASASLTAVSTLTAGAVREPQAAASLVSTSTLSVTGTRTQLATAALTASSTLAASAVRVPQAAASLTATSTLTVTAVRVVVASAPLSATSTLASAAVGIGIVQATATLSATSTLSVTGTRVPQAAASLVATSTLTTIGVRVSGATVVLSATSTLTVTGVRVAQATVALSATSTLSIAGVRVPQAAASLVAASVLSTTGTVSVMGTIRNLSGAAIQVRHPDASWHALTPV